MEKNKTDVERKAGGPATCPSCHAEDLTMTNGAVDAGAYWTCGRCGQKWDAVRLTRVAAYAVWESERSAIGR